MFCSKCGTSLPEGVSVCPKCGFSEEPVSPKSKKMRRMVIGALSVPIWIPILIAAVAASAVGVTAAAVVVPSIIANRSASAEGLPAAEASGSGDSVSSLPTESSSSEVSEPAEISLTFVSEAIHAFENYTNTGAACGFSHEGAPHGAYDQLTEDQRMWVLNLESVSCCNSIADAKAHLEKYMDDSMLENFMPERFLEYDGRLYIVTGGVGYISFDDVTSEDQINRTSDTTFEVNVNLYNSGGVFDSVVTFGFTDIDGTYKMTSFSGF